MTQAFFLGEEEARWLNPQGERTRGQRTLVLLAGVITLAVLRAALGGIAVVVAVLFGVGALSMWLYQVFLRATHATAAA